MPKIPDTAPPGKPEARNRYRTLTILDALVDSPDVTGSTLLVGLALLRHADAEGRCFPSITVLAQKAGVSRWTVLRAIHELETTGWLRVTRAFGRVSRYQFTPATGSTSELVAPGNPTSSTREPVPVAPVNSKGFSIKGPDKGHKEPSRRRKRRAQEEPDPRVSVVLKAFHDGYVARVGKPPTKQALDHGRAGKQIKSLPADYTAEELQKAIAVFFSESTPSFISKNLAWANFLEALPRLLKPDWGQAPRGQPRRVRYGPEQDHDPHHWDDWHELGGDRDAG